MNKRTVTFGAAVFLYAVFSLYIYHPFFSVSNPVRNVIALNFLLASAGCFVLSRRWVIPFGASFFAGLLYGFGPFLIYLGNYHPAAGTIAGLVPWFFCVSSYGAGRRFKWLGVIFSVLPFAMIIGFCAAAVHLRLFAAPCRLRIEWMDLVSIVSAPAAANRNLILLGFYHVPLICLFAGLRLMIIRKRWGVFILIAAGVAGAFLPPIVGVSPILWLSVPFCCLSVIIGAGHEGLLYATGGERRLLLILSLIMAGFSIASFLMATKCAYIFAGLGTGYVRLFAFSGKMHALTAVAGGIFYFLAGLKTHTLVFRSAVLWTALLLDVFFSAVMVADKVF